MKIRLDDLIECVRNQVDKTGRRDQMIKIPLDLLEDVYLNKFDREGIFIMEAYRQMSPKQRGALMAICSGTKKGKEGSDERHKIRALQRV